MEDGMLIAGQQAMDRTPAPDSFEQHLIVNDRHDETSRRRARRARAHLAPWQASLARDMMLAQISCGLALADIAARLNMTVNHFIKAFRETEGVAPYHWFMQRRIARSMAMLRDETMTLSKVADECGFADQSHFTKAFTRLLGVSPGRWRRNAKNGSLTFEE
ncbi:AraC family transcriptional regulator [Sphingomonas sp. dw_22]|uniref:helix-turn-helix transcriptional regulator n=1 Tax=Sphingomonas sp. dw_22 TaxID=2721175 RepID=UPI001BD34D81|nr:AraC family transcriptional regulator [Sphingomonas sp. dw_22]